VGEQVVLVLRLTRLGYDLLNLQAVQGKRTQQVVQWSVSEQGEVQLGVTAVNYWHAVCI
jgi:hypothetical protein